jgi:hypothetical protein
VLKGREAIACDAVGALDAVAATGTIGREEDGCILACDRVVGRSDPDGRMPDGAPAPGGPPRPSPAAGGAGRRRAVLPP